MRSHRRTAAVVTLALAGIGLLGLTACTRPSEPADAGAISADAGALDLVAGVQEQALAALGFAPEDLPADLVAAKPAPVESAGAAPSPGDREGRERDRRRKPLARALLRGRVLHAEAVVQTDDGTRTVVSQRGEITEIDDDSMSVKSADGFTLTWTFGDDLRVVERRRTVQPSELDAGVEIGVAGARDGDRSVARLIVRRLPR